MSKIQDWLSTAVGRAMNPDNKYDLQCKDVVDDFAIYLFGNWVDTIRPANAKDAYARANPDYFEKLPANTPVQAGDIPVWNGNVGGGYGHIAVVTKPVGGGFEVVQQDGFTSTRPAHLATWYTRNNVIGILRPKGQEESMATLTNLETLNAMYLTALGRLPDEGAKSRIGQPLDKMFLEVATSAEAAGYRRLLIEKAYQGALQRKGSKEEIDSWYNNVTERQAIEEIYASGEAKSVSDSYKDIPKLVKKIAELEKSQGGIDQTTKDQITETNSLLKKFWAGFKNIFNIKED